VASITCAPAGISIFAPTAAIFPSRITTVPFSIGAPAKVKTFPPLIAYAAGFAFWPNDAVESKTQPNSATQNR
jgi:hypothetical protein